MSRKRLVDAEPEVRLEPPRSAAHAALDALPDALAVAACIVAWNAPHAFGIDLVRWTTPLFFVEFPLALLAMVASIRLLPDRELARGRKLFTVGIATLGICMFAALLFGIEGFVAVAWLGALSTWRILTGGDKRDPGIDGAYVVVEHGHGGVRIGTSNRRVAAEAGKRSVVTMGHEELTAAVTLTFWWVVLVGFAFIDLPNGALAPDAPAGDGLLAKADAAYALACGIALFGMRTMMHFERVDLARAEAAPVPNVEDDPVLREIVEKLDDPPPPPRRRKRRR